MLQERIKFMNAIVEKVLAGDVKTIAQLIRDIDDEIPGTREYLKALYPHTGKAYIIGITGAPGVGKSTLVNQLICHLRKNSKTVGVVAVDPTSPFTGGAILGDRVRMQRHNLDEDVFIKSIASRGYWGGLSRSTRGVINVLDAMGKDYIIVETVGVGQGEVDIVKSAHTTVVVMSPGMGDGIQAIKAGILEVGNIFVINKADKEGADKTLSEIKMMIGIDQKKFVESKWEPPILKVEAITNKGVSELIKEIENHRHFIMECFCHRDSPIKRNKIHNELLEMVKDRIVQEVLNQINEDGDLPKYVEEIMEGKTNPYSASEMMVLPRLAILNKN